MSETIKNALKYEQKSKVFLYPFLKLSESINPIETYMFLENLKINENKNLICLFNNTCSNYQKNKKEILFNPYYELTVKDGKFDIVVFDLKNLNDDYDKIKTGDYLNLSKASQNFLKLRSSKLIVMHAFNPQFYYKDYAQYLMCDIELLKDYCLVQAPDIKNETLSITKEIKNKFEYQYAI